MPAPDLPPPPIERVERPLFAHLLPSLIEPDAMRGGVAVIIDALRASTTMAAALAAGARWIAPCLTVDEAREKQARLSAEAPSSPRPLLGGERGGHRIEGFDLDNSPAAYTAAKVSGRGICFTTTNGTAALLHARLADEVVVGTIANAGAICARLMADPRPVHLLCAGTRGEISLDDCLAAGLLAHRLIEGGRATSGQDGAILCIAALREAISHGSDGLHQAMRRSRGGRNLLRIGLAGDIALCSAPDTFGVVPRYDAASGLITPA